MNNKTNKAEIRAEYYSSPADSLFNTREVAVIIGRSIPWLHAKAHDGKGIPFLKMGQTRKYRKADIELWLDNHAKRYKSTSQYPPAESRVHDPDDSG